MAVGLSTFSPLRRGLFGTRVVMIWERLLPALFPYPLLVLILAVAGQWGLFAFVPPVAHIAAMVVGLILALWASVRAVLRFKLPTFTEVNTRLALDNGLKPERLLAMRHEVTQPRLRVGKAKAGIAASDPFALRFVALALAVLGFLMLGPVPLNRVVSGFTPNVPGVQSLVRLDMKSLALAEK